YLLGEPSGSLEQIADLSQWIEWDEFVFGHALNSGSVSTALNELENAFASVKFESNIK
ncbi:hypothetical protein HK096_009144, partial [Nowakowskiella sp. JEL0078]